MPPVQKTSQEAILEVAAALADAEGLRGVGVRAIAARLKVSPGTLYNVVGDIDDIVLCVNEQTLVRLRAALQAAVASGRNAMSNVAAMAEAYIDFVGDNPRRWSMLIEHSLASDKALPGWYQETLDQTVATVDELLKPMIPDPGERRRAVAVLWATLEGVASLTASGKLSIVTGDGPQVLVKLLIARFLGSYQPQAGDAKGGRNVTGGETSPGAGASKRHRGSGGSRRRGEP